MAERDELGRSLALARETMRGPRAMKERLRAQLAGGALATRVPATSSASAGWLAAGRRLLARRYHVATVSVLVGAGFGAGFWLGRLPSERLQENRAVAATQAAPTPAAHAASALASTRGMAGASEATSGSTADPSRTANDGATATSDAPAHPTSRASSSTTSTAASATRRRPGPRTTGAASDDSLMREVALLERIDRALRAGEGGIAAALLDELDRAVPTPALRHERAAARVLARCVAAHAGSSSAQREAHADAERFLARDLTSVYADRIRAACPLDGVQTNARARIEEPVRVGH